MPQSPPISGCEKTKPSYEEEYTREEPLGVKSNYGFITLVKTIGTCNKS